MMMHTWFSHYALIRVLGKSDSYSSSASDLLLVIGLTMMLWMGAGNFCKDEEAILQSEWAGPTSVLAGFGDDLSAERFKRACFTVLPRHGCVCFRI